MGTCLLRLLIPGARERPAAVRFCVTTIRCNTHFMAWDCSSAGWGAGRSNAWVCCEDVAGHRGQSSIWSSAWSISWSMTWCISWCVTWSMAWCIVHAAEALVQDMEQALRHAKQQRHSRRHATMHMVRDMRQAMMQAEQQLAQAEVQPYAAAADHPGPTGALPAGSGATGDAVCLLEPLIFS